METRNVIGQKYRTEKQRVLGIRPIFPKNYIFTSFYSNINIAPDLVNKSRYILSKASVSFIRNRIDRLSLSIHLHETKPFDSENKTKALEQI